jgi:hypothetical protein
MIFSNSIKILENRREMRRIDEKCEENRAMRKKSSNATKKNTHCVASFTLIIYLFSFILYTSSVAMSYLIIVFLTKSNHWTKTIESKLQCRSWSRCLENFVRYLEWRFKNQLILSGTSISRIDSTIYWYCRLRRSTWERKERKKNKTV